MTLRTINYLLIKYQSLYNSDTVQIKAIHDEEKPTEQTMLFQSTYALFLRNSCHFPIQICTFEKTYIYLSLKSTKSKKTPLVKCQFHVQSILYK